MTQGSDLYLFELPDKPAGALGSIRPVCRAVNRDVKGSDITCLDFRRSSEHPLQFAVGLVSGHAVISSFSLFDAATHYDSQKVLGLDAFVRAWACVSHVVRARMHAMLHQA